MVSSSPTLSQRHDPARKVLDEKFLIPHPKNRNPSTSSGQVVGIRFSERVQMWATSRGDGARTHLICQAGAFLFSFFCYPNFIQRLALVHPVVGTTGGSGCVSELVKSSKCRS